MNILKPFNKILQCYFIFYDFLFKHHLQSLTCENFNRTINSRKILENLERNLWIAGAITSFIHQEQDKALTTNEYPYVFKITKLSYFDYIKVLQTYKTIQHWGSI